MRIRLAQALLAGGLVAASTAHAADAEKLSFAVESETYTVPDGGLLSAEAGAQGGLTFCLAPAVEADLSAFTGSHVGETVAVAIGDTTLFHLQIVDPYKNGCITWPLHPELAKRYRARLLGE